MTASASFRAERGQQFRDAAAVIREVYEAEHAWFAQGDPASPTSPWMPFQPCEFLSILFECVSEMAEGREFLDIGCGPGTKMRLARHFFGLEAQGIEINEEMAAAAAAHGTVFPADALDAVPGFYSVYDLIWLYRPFRDPDLERQLEARVMSEMKPGAILAGAMWEMRPADLGWFPVVDNLDLPRGAWRKPRPVTTLKL